MSGCIEDLENEVSSDCLSRNPIVAKADWVYSDVVISTFWPSNIPDGTFILTPPHSPAFVRLTRTHAPLCLFLVNTGEKLGISGLEEDHLILCADAKTAESSLPDNDQTMCFPTSNTFVINIQENGKKSIYSPIPKWNIL